jgi:hypothetical protein
MQVAHTAYLPESMIAANTNGYEALFDGESIKANPYAEGSDEYRAWEAGYLQAAGDRRDAQ